MGTKLNIKPVLKLTVANVQGLITLGTASPHTENAHYALKGKNISKNLTIVKGNKGECNNSLHQ